MTATAKLENLLGDNLNAVLRVMAECRADGNKAAVDLLNRAIVEVGGADAKAASAEPEFAMATLLKASGSKNPKSIKGLSL